MKIAALVLSLLVTSSAFAYEISDKNERNPKQEKIEAPGGTPQQPSPNEKWRVHDPEPRDAANHRAG